MKWITKFTVPDVPSVPDDTAARQAAREATEEAGRAVVARQVVIASQVRTARQHLKRNHYAQRMFEAYGGGNE